jgi:hypothetical protein
MVVPSGLFHVPCVFGAEEVEVDDVGLGLATGAALLLGLGLGTGAALGLVLATGLMLGAGLATGLVLAVGLATGLVLAVGLAEGLGLATVVVQLFRHVVLVDPPVCPPWPAKAGTTPTTTADRTPLATISLRSDMRTPGRRAHSVCTGLREATH